MARGCTVCASEHRDTIDACIITGDSSYAIADAFGLSASAVQRHAKSHLNAALSSLHSQVSAGEDCTLLDWVKMDQERTDALYLAALAAGQTAQALNVLKERRGQHELLARLTSVLDSRPQVTVNLMASPEWLAVRDVILSALMQYPDARAAVSGRLLELEAGS